MARDTTLRRLRAVRSGATALLLACTTTGCLLPALATQAEVAADGGADASGCVPTGPTHGGHNVLDATLAAMAGHTKAVQQVSALPPSSTVHFGVWVRGNGQFNTFAIDSSWQSQFAQLQCTASPERWTLCSGTFDNGAYTSVNLGFQADFAGPGDVQLDDAFLTTDDDTTNRLTNPGFEDGSSGWMFGGPAGYAVAFSVQSPAGAGGGTTCP